MRTIDHHQRRQEIAAAVWRVLERDGIDEASVRHVANEAGLSTGSLRHFFTTQAELHEFALTSLSTRVSERVQMAASEPDIRRRVLAMIAELMPLRDETARELTVWFEFVHRARRDQALSRVIRGQASEVRQFLRQVADGLRELGHIPLEQDVDQVAAELNAVVDGLTFELLTAPHLLDRDQASAVLERFLFGREP